MGCDEMRVGYNWRCLSRGVESRFISVQRSAGKRPRKRRDVARRGRQDRRQPF